MLKYFLYIKLSKASKTKMSWLQTLGDQALSYVPSAYVPEGWQPSRQSNRYDNADSSGYKTDADYAHSAMVKEGWLDDGGKAEAWLSNYMSEDGDGTLEYSVKDQKEYSRIKRKMDNIMRGGPELTPKETDHYYKFRRAELDKDMRAYREREDAAIADQTAQEIRDERGRKQAAIDMQEFGLGAEGLGGRSRKSAQWMKEVKAMQTKYRISFKEALIEASAVRKKKAAAAAKKRRTTLGKARY